MIVKDIAVNLIKYYVLRGDTIEDLRKSYMGQGCSEYNVAIHGNAWNDKDELIHEGKSNDIVVSKINGKNCCYVFRLDELYNEIKSGQMSLI